MGITQFTPHVRWADERTAMVTFSTGAQFRIRQLLDDVVLMTWPSGEVTRHHAFNEAKDVAGRAVLGVSA